jgi:ABC-type phosphate transport system substrate-binding protein
MLMKSALGVAAFLAIMLVANAMPSAAEEASDFAVIANKQVAGASISMAQLKGIYLREIRNWGSGGGEIVVVVLDKADSFYQNLFGKTTGQMQAYWLNMRIKNNIDLPVTKKDAESVKQYVSENKGAIGFIKKSEADDRVKVLTVTN